MHCAPRWTRLGSFPTPTQHTDPEHCCVLLCCCVVLQLRSLTAALAHVQAGTGDVRRMLSACTFRPRLPGMLLCRCTVLLCGVCFVAGSSPNLQACQLPPCNSVSWKCPGTVSGATPSGDCQPSCLLSERAPCSPQSISQHMRKSGPKACAQGIAFATGHSWWTSTSKGGPPTSALWLDLLLPVFVDAPPRPTPAQA